MFPNYHEDVRDEVCESKGHQARRVLSRKEISKDRNGSVSGEAKTLYQIVEAPEARIKRVGVLLEQGLGVPLVDVVWMHRILETLVGST